MNFDHSYDFDKQWPMTKFSPEISSVFSVVGGQSFCHVINVSHFSNQNHTLNGMAKRRKR